MAKTRKPDLASMAPASTRVSRKKYFKRSDCGEACCALKRRGLSRLHACWRDAGSRRRQVPAPIPRTRTRPFPPDSHALGLQAPVVRPAAPLFAPAFIARSRGWPLYFCASSLLLPAYGAQPAAFAELDFQTHAVAEL